MITYIWVITRQEEGSKEYIIAVREDRESAIQFKEYCDRRKEPVLYAAKKFKNTNIKE